MERLMYILVLLAGAGYKRVDTTHLTELRRKMSIFAQKKINFGYWRDSQMRGEMSIFAQKVIYFFPTVLAAVIKEESILHILAR